MPDQRIPAVVLAIDPGPERSAWVVYDGGCILRSKLAPNADLLETLRERPHAGLPSHAHLAVEMVQSFGMPVGREVFETVFWAGRFVEAWGGGPWSLVYRKDVKLHLCGSLRAKDSNIRQSLIDRLGPQGTKKAPGPTHGLKGDLWSALAVAVTWLETQ